MFLISGEPGIGKTRLIEEIGALAQRQELRVLLGRCVDDDEAVPYLPFVEMLESCATGFANGSALRTLLGEEGPELARLMPKLRRLMPDLPQPPELPAEQARRNLYNCFRDFVGRLAREQATLLIVEDLHWADDSTLSLLDHLAQRLRDVPLLIIGTYRDFQASLTSLLGQTLENLLRRRVTDQIALKRLSRDEVSQMLKVLGGHKPPSALANQVYDETAGNPFFVEELFRHLVEENRFFDTVGRFRTELNITEGDVPRNVRLVICRRLARLQENTRKVLEVAAVIGRVFEFGLLLRSVEVNSDSAIQSLKEADDAGLISSCSPSAQARFEFSHELIRQTILSELPVPRRQVLHLEVAGAIERLNDSGQHHHAAILAHQLLQAGAAAEPTRTLKSLVAAAESAKEQQAFREAEKDYRHALLILKELPETAERDARELDLLMKVVPLVWTNQGFGGEQLQELNARCRVLAERTGELSSLINDA